MDSSTPIRNTDLRLYYGFSAIVVLCAALALYTEAYAIAAFPAALLGALLLIKDIRVLYYAFFALLPFSIEVQLGSFGTDLPSEPMMLALTGIGIVLFLKNLANIPRKYIYHPLSAIILLHLAWIFITAIFSQIPVISFKFLVAKLWYIIPFYFLGFYMLDDDRSVYTVFRYLTIFLIIAVSIVLVRHAQLGFTFDTSNEVVYPIFRNHVNYAAMLVAAIPYLWALWKNEKKTWQLVGLGILLLGTYFSYTRAAHLCIFIMIGGYYIFKFRLGKLALIVSAILAIVIGSYFTTNNRYLDFAPDFEKTITHDNFENLVEATVKLEDISTMERVYRWVAGGYMIGERPMLGYGPGGFYHNYMGFTVTSFETYVSDNPEKSGIHCYYLMTWVEQGIVGLIIFLALCAALLLIGEQAFYLADTTDSKNIVIAAVLSTLSICALLLINDLIEADKIGPLFFLNASIIAIYHMRHKNKGGESA